jgi:fatty-acyl-CoA synthase
MSRREVTNPYETDLEPNPANYVALTPLSFIARAASVYPNHASVIHGEKVTTWHESYCRVRRLASALSQRGIGKGDTVAVLAPNTPAIFEASYGIPMAGAVVNTINTRLDAQTIAFILEHGEAKVLIADQEFAEVVEQALSTLEYKPLLVNSNDAEGPAGISFGTLDYEQLLAEGDPEYDWQGPDSEWDAISLNYTSGTTGNPKGVVYHHRGAYLNALSNALGWNMGSHPVYLWTLPMFHCNGWCFPWTLAAVAGTSVCLRRVEAKSIYDAIADHRVSHLCGAPVVLGMLLNAPEEQRRKFDQQVEIMTAAAPPPAAMLEGMASRGFDITHVYGLTETYGPATICAWKDEWNQLPGGEQAALKSRQGVRYHALEGLSIRDPETMLAVPADGETMGEVMFRGNIVMKGYLKNPAATRDAFAGGWFHSGDLGVMHPDGYIQLKDRSKDIIISGGENISSIEVEDALYRHPAILDAAVVARSDEKWGESVCAFVTLKATAEDITDTDIIAFCREHLAGFKVPRTVVFEALPKTSTGKIQKFRLRERAEQLSATLDRG